MKWFVMVWLFSWKVYAGKLNAVDGFEIQKYLGKWYEIARTDNRFERGCEDVIANYDLREDGKISVMNQCLVGGKVKVSKGVAYFREKNTVGKLKVSFFWPFYGDYNVVYVDGGYRYAIVDGSDGYLWILAREKVVGDVKMKDLLDLVKKNGVEEEDLIYTRHG